MRKIRLRLCVLLVFMVPGLGMMAAFEEAGERTPLLSEGQDWRPTKVLWERKTHDVLAAQGQAMVVYLPKNGDKYCMTCDMREEKVSELYTHRFSALRMIRPVFEVLKDQFLRGYILKDNKDNQGELRVNAAFGINDADLTLCVPYGFLSETLKNFLRRDCSVLAHKGKVSFDDGIKRFTEDMRKNIVPLFQELRWMVVDKDYFLDSVEKDTKDHKALIFVVLSAEGILCGQWERTIFTLSSGRPRSSLYDIKMMGAWREMQSTYPFTREAYAQCLDAR